MIRTLLARNKDQETDLYSGKLCSSDLMMDPSVTTRSVVFHPGWLCCSLQFKPAQFQPGLLPALHCFIFFCFETGPENAELWSEHVFIVSTIFQVKLAKCVTKWPRQDICKTIQNWFDLLQIVLVDGDVLPEASQQHNNANTELTWIPGSHSLWAWSSLQAMWASPRALMQLKHQWKMAAVKCHRVTAAHNWCGSSC